MVTGGPAMSASRSMCVSGRCLRRHGEISRNRITTKACSQFSIGQRISIDTCAPGPNAGSTVFSAQRVGQIVRAPAAADAATCAGSTCWVRVTWQPTPTAVTRNATPRPAFAAAHRANHISQRKPLRQLL